MDLITTKINDDLWWMPLNQAALYPENWGEILSLTWYAFLHQTISARYFLCKYLYLYSTTEPKQWVFQAEVLAFLKILNCSILEKNVFNILGHVYSTFGGFCLRYLWHSHFLFCFKHFSHKIATEVILLLDAFRTKKVAFWHFSLV